MKNAFVALLALGMLGGCQTCDSDRTVRYVDEFDLTGAVSGYGATTRARKSVAGNPLKLNGKVYARGFGDHPESALAFTADGKVLAFEATVGLDDDSMEAAKGSYGKPTGEFKVWADGKGRPCLLRHWPDLLPGRPRFLLRQWRGEARP